MINNWVDNFEEYVPLRRKKSLYLLNYKLKYYGTFFIIKTIAVYIKNAKQYDYQNFFLSSACQFRQTNHAFGKATHCGEKDF